MDLGSILGVVFSIGFLLLSLLLTVEFNLTNLLLYVDAPSVMLVIGGSFSSLLLAYPLNKVITAFAAFGKALFPPKLDPREVIQNIITLSNLARRESLLALEEPVKTMDDPFLQKGIMLVVDGADPELIRNVLDTEIAYIEKRHADIRSVWEFWALSAPAWGMMGTVVGLVNMLNNLDDPSKLGTSMSMVVITTFYGAIIANVFGNPVANKLKIFSNDELLMKEVLIEGILSIQAGDHPRIIEEKLKAFLSPALRKMNEAVKESEG